MENTKKPTMMDEIFFVASCMAAAPFIPAATIVVGGLHAMNSIDQKMNASKAKRKAKKQTKRAAAYAA